MFACVRMHASFIVDKTRIINICIFLLKGYLYDLGLYTNKTYSLCDIYLHETVVFNVQKNKQTDYTTFLKIAC